MINDFNFKVKCIDPLCYLYNQPRFVNGRRSLLEHIAKKQTHEIINILKPHNIINNYSILSRWSLVNILADCCYLKNASKLLGDKVQ